MKEGEEPTLGIIQARMGSSRLPGKVMEDLAGRPVLEWVVTRARQADILDAVTVATSTSSKDDAIETWCQETGVGCHRGPEEDVLTRFQQISEDQEPKAIARLTGDCPLLDPDLVDEVGCEFSKRKDADYVATGRSYPEGFGVEVLDPEVLRTAHDEAERPSDREHVTPYIWRHPDRFDVVRINPHEDLSGFRLTLDYPVDLEVLREVVDRHPGPADTLGLEDALSILREDPELAARNSHVEYQEGYRESVSDEME